MSFSKKILALSIALHSSADIMAQSDNTSYNTIEQVLSTYPQIVQNIVRKSYCYEFMHDSYRRSISNCIYDTTGKIWILKATQIRAEILQLFENFPKESRLENSSWHKLLQYHWADMGELYLEKHLEKLKLLKDMDLSSQQRLFQSQEWSNYLARFDRLLLQQE